MRQPDMRIRFDRDHPDHPLSSEMVITVAGVERLRNMPHTSSILCADCSLTHAHCKQHVSSVTHPNSLMGIIDHRT